jgi:flagellar biosynthesis anti-sigma factor FlgM
MTRIDGNQGTPLPGPIDRTEAGRTNERAQNQARAAKADRVEVSPDAALLNTAMQAAHEAPAIRQDKVEAARKALESGTLGADSAKLADVLIEHMMDEKK